MKQKTALEIMKTGKDIFLTGGAGSGKTHILNEYINYLKKNGVKTAVTASTGIAASHIGGSTIHSWSGLGVRSNIDDYVIESLLEKKYLYERIKNTKVLIIDEISMLSGSVLESIDKILKAFMQNHKAFGGVQVILTGDFFQLPPIGLNKDGAKDFAWKNQIWDKIDLHICYLKEQHRQNKEDKLNGILSEIREGSVSEDSMQEFRGRYKKNLDGSINPTKLYTHNIDVDKINQEEIDKIDGPEYIYKAEEKGKNNLVESLKKTVLAKEELILKKNAVVIFIKNNYERGYLNGTTGKVTSFEDKIPIVEIFSGKKIKVDREQWQTVDENKKVLAEFSQIPLRLAWAITIHKSQGMSLDAAEMDLSKSFESGQGYVALSRLTSLDGLRLMGLNKKALEIDSSVIKVDKEFRKKSDDLEKSYLNNDQEFENFQKIFLDKNGTNKDYTIQPDTDFENTYEKTKKLLGKSVKDISKERGISEETIFKHLNLIKKDDPSIDLSFYKPNEDVFKMVKEAYYHIQKKGKSKDFLENGNVRLRSIYDFLEEKVSYDDIKITLLFLF